MNYLPSPKPANSPLRVATVVFAWNGVTFLRKLIIRVIWGLAQVRVFVTVVLTVVLPVTHAFRRNALSQWASKAITFRHICWWSTERPIWKMNWFMSIWMNLTLFCMATYAKDFEYCHRMVLTAPAVWDHLTNRDRQRAKTAQWDNTWLCLPIGKQQRHYQMHLKIKWDKLLNVRHVIVKVAIK